MSAALTLTLWALAALGFGLLAVTQVRRAGKGLSRRAFTVALSATALWALAMAGIDARDLAPGFAEVARTLAWLGFMAALAWRGERCGGAAVAAVYGVVACVTLAGAGLVVAGRMSTDLALAAAIADGRLLLQMMAAVSALVLTHHLRSATERGARDGLRVVIAALAAMWALDLCFYAAAYFDNGWSPALVTARALTTLALAPVLAVAAHRDGDWTLQLSRTVAYQSLSALVAALYLGGTLSATSLLARWGGSHVRLWQTAFVFGATTALLTLISTPWLRAVARTVIAKHLFSHRFDYRAEWVRFTDTLGLPGNDAAPLERRVLKAVADLIGSPAGLLLASDGPALGTSIGWNWDGEAFTPDEGLARHLATTGRIVELDAVRAGTAAADERAAVPEALLRHAEAWAVAPLFHFGQLVGAIVLARPPVDRTLDWEDLDLLRIAGRQAASYLAEARALGELADARRFDEFNRRFALIMHDIKNLVSQLSLVARNAERHAANPAFRADMIATLQDSAERMTALLARLSQQQVPRPEPMTAVDVIALAQGLARRVPYRLEIGGQGGIVLADPARLEQLLRHLLQNAAEASAEDAAIMIQVTADAAQVRIEVADRGCGMTPAFVREELFRPFHSSKPGGFGIGAYEARALAEAMGGGVEVWSREGEGTRFTVRLPTAPALEQAA